MTSMWTTVLALAMALNLEPFRVGLVPLMLSRPRPFLQLAAFLFGGLTMAVSAGLIVLFAFDRSPLGSNRSDGARVQLSIGVLALVIAAGMALWPQRRPGTDRPGPQRRPGTDRPGPQRRPGTDRPGPQRRPGTDRPGNKTMTRVRDILRKGSSPWWAAAIGLGTGLPSVDYLAVLLVIGSSGAAPPTQVGALLAFLLVGNAVVLLPLVSLLVAPQRTRDWLGRFQGWIQTRTRRDFAGLFAALGVLLVLLGYSGL